jgi:hypothetical protein
LLAYAFPKPFEVLRIEARLGQRQKIKPLLERLYNPLAVAEGHLKAFEALRLKDYSVREV